MISTVTKGDLHLVELHLFEFFISTEIQCISVEMEEPSFDPIKLQLDRNAIEVAFRSIFTSIGSKLHISNKLNYNLIGFS